MEEPYINVEVLLLAPCQHFLGSLHRHTMVAVLAPGTVEQPVVTVVDVGLPRQIRPPGLAGQLAC
jgi:hypothetical protein